MIRTATAHRSFLASAASSTRRVWIPLCLLIVCACDSGPAPQSETGSAAETPPPAPVELQPGRVHPRLVILYSTCTLNRSFLGPHNPAVPYTPHLDAFAAESTVFARHRTEAGMSGVAFASIFTGRQAPDHGIFTHPVRMAPEVMDISQVFGDAGYDTWYFADHGNADPDQNYAKGVSAQHVIRGRTLQAGDHYFRRILDGLAADPRQRVFIQAAFTETHGPYSTESLDEFCSIWPAECEPIESISPDRRDELYGLYAPNKRYIAMAWDEAMAEFEFDESDIDEFKRFIRVVYKSNVFRLDRMFGELIETIRGAGLLDDSLIIFTADHGELLFSDAAPFQISHGLALQNAVLTVPLIIRFPEGVDAISRFEGVSRSMDVLPTVAGAAGLGFTGPTGMTGVNLFPHLTGAAPAPDLRAWSHTGVVPPAITRADERTFGPDLRFYYPESDIELTWVAVRREDRVWKYRRLPDGEFHFLAYDVGTDPMETADLFAPDDPLDAEMADALIAYRENLIETYAFWQDRYDSQERLSQEAAVEKLQRLGYIQ